MPPPIRASPKLRGGSDRDHKNYPYERRRGSNSAPPFVGPLPIRLRDLFTQAPQTPIRLPGIAEICGEDSPSEEKTVCRSSNSPSTELVTPTKKDPDETESDEGNAEEERNHICEGNEEEEENHLCEFSKPCNMDPSPDGMHYRKVVSHVFGRNKASTKLFPDDVWVHYCRKHYQRARYRAAQWPFTQCDLLVESLRRMQDWGGVESFELTLRRREVLRVEEEELSRSPQSERSDRVKRDKRVRPKPSTNRTLSSGRKHPTAIVAPVPSWMMGCLGKGKTFQEIRDVIKAASAYMQDMKDRQQQANQGSSGNSTPTSNGKGKQPATPQKQSVSSSIRFPDIEILPTFKPWVHAQAQQRREAQSQGADRVAGSQSSHLASQACAPSSSRPSSSRPSSSWPSSSRPSSSRPSSSRMPQPHCNGSRNNGAWQTEVNAAFAKKGKKQNEKRPPKR